MDEAYIRARGQWMYLYRAIDSAGDTVEFWFSQHRDLPAAKRFMRKALARHGRPDRIVIDGSHTNREAIISCDAESRLRDRSRRGLKPISIRSSKYLNNRIEQDHHRIKRQVRPTIGFKSFSSAAVVLAGIEMVHMMRKRQGRPLCLQPDTLPQGTVRGNRRLNCVQGSAIARRPKSLQHNQPIPAGQSGEERGDRLVMLWIDLAPLI